MSEINLNIREAEKSDIDFIIKAIIASEKSTGQNISYCKMFDISEVEFIEFLKKILSLDIDNYEFSLSSFLILEKFDKPIATYGAWIENKNGIKSGILRMNALKTFLKKENMKFFYGIVPKISDFYSEREINSLQCEYLYVIPEERGNKYSEYLINQQLKRFEKDKCKKAQVQLMKENIASYKALKNSGFFVTEEKTADNIQTKEIFNATARLLMEKYL